MKTACVVLTAFLSVMTAHAQTNEKLRHVEATTRTPTNERLHLVEVTALTQETSLQIVTEEELQALLADMTDRNRLLPKAMDLASKEWADEHTESGPFPRQTAAKGQVESLGVFTDKKRAEQALKARQAREEEQEKKKLSGIERQLALLRDQLQKLRALAAPTVEQQNQIAGLQDNIKIFEEQVARKKKKEDERNANLIQARELFRIVLNRLLTETKKKKSSPP
jgi:hypothetical protein